MNRVANPGPAPALIALNIFNAFLKNVSHPYVCSLRGVLTFVVSSLDINGCVLSYFEETANLHCYTSYTRTTLHCSKVSFLQFCHMKRYYKIFTKIGVYSLLWDTVSVYIYIYIYIYIYTHVYIYFFHFINTVYIYIYIYIYVVWSHIRTRNYNKRDFPSGWILSLLYLSFFLQMQAYTDTVYSLKFFNVKFYHINDLSSW